MKKAVILFSLFCFLCAIPVVQAADTIFVRETRIPILIERQDNVLFYLRLDAKESQTLNDVVLNLGEGVNLSETTSNRAFLPSKVIEAISAVTLLVSEVPGFICKLIQK